jgi:hypothetical protein
MRNHWTAASLFVLVAAAFILIFGRLISSQCFTFDEADYMYAASKGFLASYLDRPSLTIADFARAGIRSGAHSGESRNLSEYIRRYDDITLYRHFHGPLYFYLLRASEALLGTDETVARWTSLFSLVLLAVIVFVGSLFLSTQEGASAGLLGSGFVLLSATSVETARWVSPHSLYAACAVATLFFLAKLVQTNTPRHLYGALFCLGLAFLTVEYAPLLLVVLLITIWIRWRYLFCGWPRRQLLIFSLKCALIPLVLMAVVWPAGIIKLTLVKNYLFFGYWVMLRPEGFGTDSPFHIWAVRIVSSPVEWLLLLSLTCYFCYLLFRNRQELYLLPFSLYAALLFLVNLKNRSPSPYYLSSLIPCLGVISGFTFFRIIPKGIHLRAAVAALVWLALVVNNFLFYYREVETTPTPDEGLVKVVSILRDSGVTRECLLLPNIYRPTVHYYFQQADLRSYTARDGTEAIRGALNNKEFNGVIYEGSDYEALRRFLEKNWSVQTIVRAESGKPGFAVAYYRLLPLANS